ncbi:MAG: hypothetical protein MUE69_29085, partial [Myxococcota bacterium]|nr:hypothetical protein [Myxococcota bacterium]
AGRICAIFTRRGDFKSRVVTRAGDVIAEDLDLEVEAIAAALEHNEARTPTQLSDLRPIEVPGAADRFEAIGIECIVRGGLHAACERFEGRAPGPFIRRAVEQAVGEDPSRWSRAAGAKARGAVVRALESLADRAERAAAAEARIAAAEARRAAMAVPSEAELADAERALTEEELEAHAFGVERIDDAAPTTDDDTDFDGVEEIDE